MDRIIVMTKEKYIKSLTDRGYELVGEDRNKLGTITFIINEGDIKTAVGMQHTFWLTILENESDLNLVPNPWK